LPDKSHEWEGNPKGPEEEIAGRQIERARSKKLKKRKN
jgi:hypothetical protein